MANNLKRGRGRPKSANPAKVYKSFRVTPAKVEEYQRAAERAGMDLSTWLRMLADTAVAAQEVLGTARSAKAPVVSQPAGKRATRSKRSRRGVKGS